MLKLGEKQSESDVKRQESIMGNKEQFRLDILSLCRGSASPLSTLETPTPGHRHQQ